MISWISLMIRSGFGSNSMESGLVGEDREDVGYWSCSSTINCLVRCDGNSVQAVLVGDPMLSQKNHLFDGQRK